MGADYFGLDDPLASANIRAAQCSVEYLPSIYDMVKTTDVECGAGVSANDAVLGGFERVALYTTKRTFAPLALHHKTYVCTTCFTPQNVRLHHLLYTTERTFAPLGQSSATPSPSKDAPAAAPYLPCIVRRP
jgi:hypothetical protein